MILRGLWARRSLALIVLIIAVVPIASAAVGPIYADAARTTILRDAVRTAPLEGRGWRYSSTGSGLEGQVADFVAGAPFVTKPVFGMETTSARARDRRPYLLIWQDGQCAHVKVVRGRCPSAALEILVSRASGFKLGSAVKLESIMGDKPGADGQLQPAPLRVVGVYEPGTPGDPFWFGRTLFNPAGKPEKDKADALFTARQTRGDVYVLGNNPEPNKGAWTDWATTYVVPDRLRGADLDRLTAMQAAAQSAGANTSAIVYSRMGDTVKEITLRAGTLNVPTLLVIGQLVGLGWLLLFQTVGDLVRARGTEIALARLRGHGRVRVWAFALSEPLLVLLAAIPLGLAAASGVSRLMVDAMLPAGIPTTLPAEAALAGAVAMVGGVLA
ncbi:MAG: hypothetical protein HOY71_35245, partial [Nonomuraea sp.]|nr:hypothetical protein [Nonomuraea sp.]